MEGVWLTACATGILKKPRQPRALMDGNPKPRDHHREGGGPEGLDAKDIRERCRHDAGYKKQEINGKPDLSVKSKFRGAGRELASEILYK